MNVRNNALLLEQLNTIAEGLSATFAPFCEVVVHDLQNPEHAILAIHNNLSGREVGEPSTEMGLARIASPEFPAIVANYANQLADGRPVKSTSIGIKDEDGDYVAALCMNVDMTLFRGMQSALAQFTQLASNAVQETIEPAGAQALRAKIDHFAARLATTPRALKAAERKQLMAELRDSGLLEMKKSMDLIAQQLGVSRASVYLYAKE
ncbi:DNA-binding protein [Pantoea rodasii]|uniref:DNA-binding protein n=1 Tax=Pantoea rodasii TaxID=1076549 RepID=A0A0B1R3B6_9GAMM|nr:PAS domain-containing protein [Pantoea rodasii]KHJ67119.1 DNA-binding protein [Pantoea rodasii]